MQGQKVQIFEVRSVQEANDYQMVLANYEFKRGKKLLLQGGAAFAKYIIAMGESVIMRDRHMGYSLVDYQGEKDLFKIQLKHKK